MIDRRAEDEAREAYLWYLERSADAAANFRRKMEEALEKIGERPESFPLYLRGTRRCMLHNFPFMIVFRDYSDHFFVVAVAHGHRRKGYWSNRLS